MQHEAGEAYDGHIGGALGIFMPLPSNEMTHYAN